MRHSLLNVLKTIRSLSVTYCYISSDLKLGYYMKIPRKLLFKVPSRRHTRSEPRLDRCFVSRLGGGAGAGGVVSQCRASNS